MNNSKYTAVIPYAVMGCFILVVAAYHNRCPAQTPAQSPAQNNELEFAPAKRPQAFVPFAPGVRIDWTHRTVEVDARVVFRKGPLELLACSPNTREHESILVVSARPLHIFQALGLMGAEPGRPMRYDIQKDKWIPPSGDILEILFRYQKDGIEYTVSARQWVLDSNTKKEPQSLRWVFAGSKSLPSGRFMADIEGTIICVVDFESAVISLNSLHSADNEMLWLIANTEAIPPINTPCTILFSSVNDKPHQIDVVVRVNGDLQFRGQLTSTADIVAQFRRLKATHQMATLRVIPTPGLKAFELTKKINALIEAGIDKKDILQGKPTLSPQ